MLAISFLRWLREHQPDDKVELAAFRGGELLDTAMRYGQVVVALDPRQRWDHDQPDPDRVREVRSRLSVLSPADVTLLVSVSAGQLLPHMHDGGAVVTWVVERGDDLHWLTSNVGLPGLTRKWLAGSSGSAEEARSVLGDATEFEIVPEFVDDPVALDPLVVSRCRRLLNQARGGLVVVGAGIATHRKAPDLFLEVALRRARTNPSDSFVWIGGESDPMFPEVLAESRRLRIDNLRLLGTVTDVDPWIAAADVFLHPAREDAFPLVCLHATRVGTPVVGFTGAGGIAEQFGPEALGTPFPDIDGLATTVTDLEDPERRRRAAMAQLRQTARLFARSAAPELRRACLEGVS